MLRVGQNRICTPYMAVYVVVFLPKAPYIHCINVCTYVFVQPYSCCVENKMPVSPPNRKRYSTCRLCNIAVLTDASMARPVNAALAAMCNLATWAAVADRCAKAVADRQV